MAKHKDEIAQEPILKQGTTVHVGPWEGVVERIEHEHVIVLLRNGRRFPVAMSIIEKAAQE